MVTDSEYVLFGVPPDKSGAFHEVVLTGGPGTTKERCELVQKLAAKDGYHSFRTVKVTPPNFAATLNTRKK